MTTAFYNDPAYQTVRSLRSELTDELSSNMQLWRIAVLRDMPALVEVYRARNAVLSAKLSAVIEVLDMIEEMYRVVPGR